MCIYLLGSSDYPGVTVDNLVRDLFLTDPASDLGDILRQKGKRIPGSCEWLLRQDEFQRWIVDDDKLHVLWLLGAPGIGKTMVSSYVVEALQEKKEEASSAIFVFYFCNDRNDNRRTTPAIVRGLLVQLLREQPGLFQAIEDDYKKLGKSIAENLSALFVALCRLLRRTETRIYILVDALDECEGSSRHDFFTFIEDLDPDMRVSILITSRPEVDVEDAAGDMTDILRIDSAKVKDDLSSFINIRVDDLAKKKKRFPSKLIDDIRSVLLQQAGGTFLWVSLALEDISGATTAKRAREKLEGLPKGLPGIYRRILENIREDDVNDAAFILRWAVASRRPMTDRELATAQAMANWKGDTVPESDDLDELMDGYRVCGPLLFYDVSTKTVNLVHQSAKDFLTGVECPGPYRVDRNEARVCILQTCFDYLAFPEFEQGKAIFDLVATLPDCKHENAIFNRGRSGDLQPWNFSVTLPAPIACSYIMLLAPVTSLNLQKAPIASSDMLSTNSPALSRGVYRSRWRRPSCVSAEIYELCLCYSVTGLVSGAAAAPAFRLEQKGHRRRPAGRQRDKKTAR